MSSRQCQRTLAAIAAVGLLVGISGCTPSRQLALRRPPNILLVLFDDVGYEGFAISNEDWPGWQTPVRTPHIDSLAAAGMRFTQYYTASPVCSPTRVSMLTGSYPQRINVRKQLPLAGTARGIPAQVTTLPELLRSRGYRTAHFGKWHVGMDRPEYLPPGVGFDESVTLRTLRYNDPVLQFGDGSTRRVEGHSTGLLSGYADDFIRRNRDRPFFVNLWLWTPHAPSQAPGDDWEQFSSYSSYLREVGLNTRDAELAALITNADAKLGELLATLEELDLADDTIVVVTSDNGGMLRGSIAANASLRGFKGDPFEGGSRVPLVVRWPRHVAPGRVDDTPVMSFDLVPTLAAAAGLDPGEIQVDGRSFLGFLLGDGPRPLHERLFWETTPCNALSDQYLNAHPEGRWHDFAVRRGPWKLVYEAVVDDPATRMVRCGEEPLRGPQWHLFDVERDPRETIDLILEEPAWAQALYSDYLDWRARVALLAFDVEARGGAAEVVDRDLILAGGYVRLAPSALYDFHDGSFSFTALALAAERGPQIIAQRRGSWTLRLAADGAVELVVVRDRDGREFVLHSTEVLPLEEWTRISFSVFGLKQAPAAVRLFLGEELVAEDNRNIPAVTRSSETVTLGGDPSSETTRFRGILRDVELRVGSLMTEEIERLEKSALFFDSFESDDLSRWNDRHAIGAAELEVDSRAAFAGRLGLSVRAVQPGDEAWVGDSTPRNETAYGARFLVGPAGMSARRGTTQDLLVARGGEPAAAAFGIRLRRAGGRFELVARARSGDGWEQTRGWPIVHAPAAVEVEWQAAEPPYREGRLQLWVNGTPAGDLRGLDNAGARVDQVRLGLVGPVAPGTTGTLSVDHFESYRRFSRQPLQAGARSRAGSPHP